MTRWSFFLGFVLIVLSVYLYYLGDAQVELSTILSAPLPASTFLLPAVTFGTGIALVLSYFLQETVAFLIRLFLFGGLFLIVLWFVVSSFFHAQEYERLQMEVKRIQETIR